eukprot:Awhi_evm1s887
MNALYSAAPISVTESISTCGSHFTNLDYECQRAAPVMHQNTPPLSVQQKTPPIPQKIPPLPVQQKTPPVPQKVPPLPVQQKIPPLPVQQKTPPVPKPLKPKITSTSSHCPSVDN